MMTHGAPFWACEEYLGGVILTARITWHIMYHPGRVSTTILTGGLLAAYSHSRSITPGAPHAALACRGFEFSAGRGFSHDAVRANATDIQIRLRISRISSSRKQLWVGHVFFRFGTIRRGDQRESMLLQQSRRSRWFRSNSYDCGDPKEPRIPIRVAQRSQASWSAGEWREAPFDS